MPLNNRYQFLHSVESAFAQFSEGRECAMRYLHIWIVDESLESLFVEALQFVG